ncbi:sugar ABC transporter ATP-binding protein [Halalkalibacter sp. APA_J-10(15)]|uniref:sugar ABC transporter ATP-binding protein n=1 Tax=Halalkalibacter sp. APA_J-10(15) TaxID=2933805 RepID=UPI001FF57B2B|nr:sugar ABC transporter ATP-binding protein [Halalkalibacter sp. APA_J-10(15)]MCK0471595.1 sugar ABC transporter ATP-binding protein [Halalkalibacter sp. APA_J-10(15)]
MSDEKPILTMEGITKEFPGVKALSNVAFRLFPGEVHALMGENGAGKSTLIKVLTGVYTYDQGIILLEDNELHVTSPIHSQEVGISTVYQEVNLCPNLSVVENIFIGRELLKRGRIDWKTMKVKSEQILKRLDLTIDVTKELSSYSVAIQQMIAIARALNISCKVLILDEPTSSLDLNEVQQLFNVMRKLRQEGMAIIFISHFLDQIYEIADRMTVLRNGQLIGEYLTYELPRFKLVEKMIGTEKEQLDAKLEKESQTHIEQEHPVFLKVVNGSKKGSIQPFHLTLHSNEIVGFAGLLGSGRTEIARLLFGADKLDDGEMYIRGQKVDFSSPKQAIKQRIAFCSENRKADGIIPELTVRENMILAIQGVYGWFSFIPKKKQIELADQYIELLNINPRNPEQLIKNLSGGNQQKVLLARWLMTNPDLLILDEPTRGIDVGAKAEIEKLMIRLSEEGKSIVFISAELEEVIRCSRRVIVLRDREKVSEWVNEGQLDQSHIMEEMAGGNG